MADLIESHFYALIPPEKRPRLSSTASHGQVEDDATNSEETPRDNEKSPEDGKAEMKDEGRLHSRGGLPVKSLDEVKNGKKRKYPKRPLLSAIHRAFFWRWWIAGLLDLCASKFGD